MGAPSNAVDPSSTTLSAEDMDSADADADQEPLDLIHLGQTSFDGSLNAVLYSKKDFDVTDADQAAKFLKEVYNYLTYLQNSNVRLDTDRLKTLKKIEKQVDKGSDSRAATQQRSRSKKYPRFESKKRSNKSQKLGGDGVAGGSGSKYKLNDDETLEVMATTTSKLLSEENMGSMMLSRCKPTIRRMRWTRGRLGPETITRLMYRPPREPEMRSCRRRLGPMPFEVSYPGSTLAIMKLTSVTASQ